MEKVVTFSTQNETIEAWSPLSTGTLGVSVAAKDTTGFSPINSSNNVSSNNDEWTRPATPTRQANPFSSTPFVLSASTSSPNLLIEKSNQSVFSKYRDSPKSKLNSVKFQDQLKQLQTQIAIYEQRQEAMEKENVELRRQTKILQDHIAAKESNFNSRIEEAVRIEEENATLTRAVAELRDRLTAVMCKLTEAESEATRINSDMDEKVAKIASLTSELRSSEAKIVEITEALQHFSSEDERLMNDNKHLQQQVKVLESDLSAMRTKCQDEHDLLVAVERQRDALEDKLRQRERRLEELEACGADNATAGAATSQLELHMLSQMESILAKKFSELAEKLPTQMSNPSATASQSQSFVPSAPASISGNDYDDISKADSISNVAVAEMRSELEQFSITAGDTTVTSNGGAVGLGTFGGLNGMATSTWKKPTAVDRSQVLDWLPLEPENEEMFEEEARWRDREFLKRTAMGAATRKRLIMEEESRRPENTQPPTTAIDLVSQQEETNNADRLIQLAERNRKQPMHMRSAYPIEEATFLINENDLRTGKTMTNDGPVSSTPVHSDQSQSQARLSHSQQLRAAKVPVSRPVSMYATAPQPKVSSNPAPSSIPKPTQMVFSPTLQITKAESVADTSSVSAMDNKENNVSKVGSSALLIISPPTRISKSQAATNAANAKAADAEKKAKSTAAGTLLVISPPRKNAASNAAQKHDQTSNSAAARKGKSTSTPKKFLGAVARAFGSTSKNAGGDQMKTDV